MSIRKRTFLVGLSVLVLAGIGYVIVENYYKIGFKGNVCLIVLGKSNAAEVALMKRQIHQFYGLNIIVLPVEKLPPQAYYAPRHRYRANLLLDYLADIKPPTQDKIIAFTQEDISVKTTTQADWGIFGLARVGDSCCVISTFRLHPAHSSKEQFRQRLTKVTLHEVGHTLGLPHCDESIHCLMNDAKGSMKTVDREKIELCAKCLNKISYIRI